MSSHSTVNCCINSRQGDRVVKRAAWVASGIRQYRHREILGITLGDSESYTTWDEMFRWLKGRGLVGGGVRDLG